MRTLTAICVATFLVGCGEQPQWQRTTHSLTPIQIDRQQELINDGQLLFEYPNLIGNSTAEYSELISLANETAVRNAETVYMFLIPGGSDDGSDGQFYIAVISNKITESAYHSLEH